MKLKKNPVNKIYLHIGHKVKLKKTRTMTNYKIIEPFTACSTSFWTEEFDLLVIAILLYVRAASFVKILTVCIGGLSFCSCECDDNFGN